jgi:hypothetical protein
MTFQAVVERLVATNTPNNEANIRSVCAKLPEGIRRQFTDASGMTDSELEFAFNYAEYYLATRGGTIISDQFFWSIKYAFTIAPIMAAMHPDSAFSVKYVGETVEYSFSSVRTNFKHDPADYDPGLMSGAVLLRLAGCHGTDHDVVSEIGASWRLVVAHWDELGNKDSTHMLEFVRHVTSGGSVHLADGLL